MRKKLSKNKILTIILIFQIFMVKMIGANPTLVEKYYSNGVYIYISSFLRTLFGWLPFSFGDLLFLLVLIWVIIKIIKFYKLKPKNWSNLLFSVTAKLSIVYFLFHFLWGFNYYRQPLQTNLKLTVPKYNVDELNLLSEKLLIEIQDIHFKITKNDTLKVINANSTSAILNQTVVGYQYLAKTYPQFKYKRPKVKKSFFSLFYGFTGTAGFFNPFTGEAHINYKVPKYATPAIATHEIAHQLGYANESEANFIGYLAAINNSDLHFQYAAYLMAFNYTLNEIYRSDPDLYKELVNRLPKGVQKNRNESRKFWQNYKNPLDPVFQKFYDLFLKANAQKAGVKSYGKMVGLLMAYYKDKSL